MGKQTGGRKTGFTLIEVLLTTFLVLLISGLIFTSFFIPTRAVSSAKSRLKNTEEPAVFLSRISEEIAAAYPGDYSFSGTENSLWFISAAGTNLGLEKVKYVVERAPAEERVIVYRQSGPPYSAEDSKNKAPVTEEKGRPVLQAESLKFSYYDGKEWQKEWTGKRLPPLVSVDLFRKGQGFQVFCRPRAGISSDISSDSGSGSGYGGTSPLP